jgi:hypothetical protein
MASTPLLNPNLTPQQPDYSQASYNYQWQQVQSAIDAVYASIAALQAVGSNIQNVGTANAQGSDTAYAADNHVHNFPHAGYLCTVSAGTFTFDLSGGIVSTYAEYTDPAANINPGVTVVNVLLSNAHSVSFALPSASVNLGRWYLLGTTYNTAVPVVAANGTDTIDSNQGRGHVLYVATNSTTWRNVMSINLP